jgi:hypothetical protein
MRQQLGKAFMRRVVISFSIFSSRAAILNTMKEYEDGKDFVQEIWKLAISSQSSMLDAMANTLDSYPKEIQGSCLRELYKANAAFMTTYFRTIEQAGGQPFDMQADALRRTSEALKSVLTKMEETGTAADPDVKRS